MHLIKRKDTHRKGCQNHQVLDFKKKKKKKKHAIMKTRAKLQVQKKGKDEGKQLLFEFKR